MLAANLADGNTVVFKPSERIPLCGARRPPEVDLVCRVGSVPTGREIAGRCAQRGRKALLELGGKDPLIIDASIDPGWAAAQAASGAFANAGQICTSVERITCTRPSPRTS